MEDEFLNFKQACLKLGFRNNNSKYQTAIIKASKFDTITILRGLSTTIIIKYSYIKPLKL